MLQEGKRPLFIAGWRPPSPGMWPHKGPLNPASPSARPHSGGSSSALPGPVVCPGDPGQVPVHLAPSNCGGFGKQADPLPRGSACVCILLRFLGAGTQWYKPGVFLPLRC